MKLPTSRIALRIYAIGLVQFLIVAAVLEVDHRMRYPAVEIASQPPATASAQSARLDSRVRNGSTS